MSESYTLRWYDGQHCHVVIIPHDNCYDTVYAVYMAIRDKYGISQEQYKIVLTS